MIFAFAAGLLALFTAGAYTSPRFFARRRPAPPPALPPSDPATLADLARAALVSGASVPDALRAVAAATAEEQEPCGLELTARLLVLGASWEEAWAHVPERCRILRDTLAPSWHDGAAPVPLLRRASASHRARRIREAREAAAELGTRLVLPLTTCFLPAFVLLGVVPIIASLGLAFFG
ncbi:tight adherence protein B [Actinobaculum suis]|uniref:Tight adherence protein B n=1 Tax=Actinobaculum suis TaxID=1657 RepID=A0A0K9EU64_9ACTO|nr:type II secretion system F family protein [Actinobaculum suis]KMY23402.1 membrane protein [Actinobaculum suis]MDY5152476.1 type II secretion system F family protein [Actinobaculum suis]SDE41664.1 tight adherence protein B [Actinobaculum suis]